MAAAQQGIKIGLLFDFVFPPPSSWDVKADFIGGLTLTFDEATEDGLLDRPVELVERWVEGLPRGAVKPVVDAWQELADEGCVLIIGPMISENAIAVREHIDRGGFVPSLTWSGTDEWLGHWTFAVSDGNLSVESAFIAHLAARAGHRRLGVSYERSIIGSEYLSWLRQACDREGIDIVATHPIAQTEADATDLVAALQAASPDAIAHVGFGLGLLRINMALGAAGWDPPRYTTTAWENCFLNDDLFKAFVGWVGLEHYDEENPVGEAFLDRFEKRFDRRQGYAYPLYAHDIGRVVAQALAHAQPLSPSGVRAGLERVRLLPAACGSAGNLLSLGPYAHRAWNDPRYLVARSVGADTTTTEFRGRYDG